MGEQGWALPLKTQEQLMALLLLRYGRRAHQRWHRSWAEQGLLRGAQLEGQQRPLAPTTGELAGFGPAAAADQQQSPPQTPHDTT